VGNLRGAAFLRRGICPLHHHASGHTFALDHGQSCTPRPLPRLACSSQMPCTMLIVSSRAGGTVPRPRRRLWVKDRLDPEEEKPRFSKYPYGQGHGWPMTAALRRSPLLVEASSLRHSMPRSLNG
jgi:hypothetical protein